VKSGSAFISSTGNTGAKVTNIKQNNSGVLGLEWSSFNIGRNETVNFIQPSVNSVAFNRILDSQGSQILGKINANGSVWLVNPNGLFFGKDAQVNVGGLVASTLDMANPRGFGIYSQRFTGNSLATVENQGLIAAGFTDPANSSSKMRGFVALVGHSVKNTGDIKTAEAGKIALAAGSDVNLQFSGNSLIGVSVNQNQLNAMADNGGLMQADGGQVILTAGAANSALASMVNNTGVMQAKSSAMSSGRIVLSSAAKDGQLNLSGRLDASGTNGADGGAIETQASVIRVSDGTVVDTSSTAGSWGKWSLIQKNTAQSKSDAKLSSMISGSTLGEALNHSNVSLYTDKDLRIDTGVTWNAPSKLSIVTQRNIAIDAPINSAHTTGSMSLAYGQASTNGVVEGVNSSYTVKAPVSLMEGNNFTTQQGSAGAVKNFYVITRLGLEGSNTGKDLQGILWRAP
jgi:filamentous hemagglutinin family protein